MKPTPLITYLSSHVLFILFFFPFNSHSLHDPIAYGRCAPFPCGNLNLTFPFYSQEATGDDPRCGLPGYEIACNTVLKSPTVVIGGKTYEVRDSYRTDRLVIVSDFSLISDLRSQNCDNVQNVSASVPARLELVASSTNLTLFRCDRGLNLPGVFLERVRNFTECGGNDTLYLVNGTDRFKAGCGDIDGPDGCTCFSVPVLASSLLNASILLELKGLADVLSRGFPLQWPEGVEIECSKCQDSNERCGFDLKSGAIVCLSRFTSKDESKAGSKLPKRVIIGAASAGTFLIFALVALAIFKYKNKALSIINKDHIKSKRSRDEDRNVDQFIKSYQSKTVNKYSYSEIQKMTNNFNSKLGQGGYGSVYKGKLADGRLIAAKMLEKSRDYGQDFINEVDTIGRIHHVNVIRLLGFCCEGSKRALVYEFMPNGSLGNLISNENAGHCLGWPKLLEIAIGIAHGIQYLHQGCDTRILHLDIKPHNILLDHNYSPKISDFGLAKSYSRKHSVVPLTNARGTVGYIAPEVFLRSLGGVSHKSDVYSYGMLLLEMVGCRKMAGFMTEHSSKTYFPNWIYEQMAQEGEIDITDSIVEEDASISRKMVMVGLWCIQMNPVDRPSITRVLEMLMGRLDGIEMPPKPFLFSPPRTHSQHEISSKSTVTQDMPLMSQST